MPPCSLASRLSRTARTLATTRVGVPDGGCLGARDQSLRPASPWAS
jgi:hypothetical protein